MSAMANATPIVTTVTKTKNKEKAPDAAPRVNIIDFCKEYYEDILSIIMDKARCDKQKEKTCPRESIRRDPGLAVAKGATTETCLAAWATKGRACIRDLVIPTYQVQQSPGQTRRTRETPPRRERPRIEERSRGTEESYGDTYSQGTKTKYKDRSLDGD
ncbi:hypothetical protein Tco_1486454 [Tanacetum coccineum]